MFKLALVLTAFPNLKAPDARDRGDGLGPADRLSLFNKAKISVFFCSHSSFF